jgi:dyslexia susceptibility 1 candidate gene 1 protein
MPILVKDFDWNQSDSKITIRLPLKGAKSRNINVVTSNEYLKVSYPPFYFECWLNAKIDDDKSLLSINDGIVSLELFKLEEKIWESLHNNDHENKELMMQIRQEALEYSRDKDNRRVKEKAELIATNKKIALQEQMKLEQEDKTRIEGIKENEKKKATEEIELFKDFHKQTMSKEVNRPKLIEIHKDKENEKPTKSIYDPLKVQEENIKIQPNPRTSSKIQIKFTPRIFPTPSRESTDNAEKEWLEKQLEARKLLEISGMDDLSQEEKNIDWLKEKGSKLYKEGNYLGAIGVYNHAIKLFSKNPS